MQIGEDINGESAYDSGPLGANGLSISNDGLTVAIGARGADGVNGADSGHVRVYTFDPQTSSWSQLGADIDGEAPGDSSGGAVSISADGSVVAIGAYTNDGGGTNSGHVRVYRFNAANNNWIQVGADIDGQANDFMGNNWGVSLSADGNTVVANGGGNFKVYDFDPTSNSWMNTGYSPSSVPSFTASNGPASAVSITSDVLV